jgi:hypothetical protein
MKEITVTTINELVPLLHVHGWHYKLLRGHADASWKLKPGLTRDIADPAIAGDLDKELFDTFRAEVFDKGLERHFNSPDNKKWQFANDWEWYFQAQHCRLKTRLMDWTIEGKIAISFMMGPNENQDKIDGAIWILYADQIHLKATTEEDDYKNIHPLEFSESLMIYPPAWHTDDNYEKKLGGNRLINQRAKFTTQSYDSSVIPMEEQVGITDCLTKVIIPHTMKKEIRANSKRFIFDEEELYFKSSFGLDDLAMDINRRIFSECR